MDPRINIIDKRLAKIKKVIAISGGKGGIGKSLIASTLALTLSKAGYKVGLLDLDFWGPSAHVILGIKGVHPKEEKGIVPPKACGIEFMSVIYYAADKPLPLRNIGFTQATIELLAITQWGQLDFLIIDMPPGIGDAMLEVIRLVKKANFCIIATQSKVVLETVKKTLKMLKELDIPILGVIENMKIRKSSLNPIRDKTPEVSDGCRREPISNGVKEQIKTFNVPFLGEINFDAKLEDSIGDAVSLLETDFAKSVDKYVAGKVIKEMHKDGS